MKKLNFLVIALSLNNLGFCPEDEMGNTSQKEYALVSAAGTGNLNEIRCLVAQGAKVNEVLRVENLHTPLMEAVFRGHVSAVQLLLDLGANVDERTTDGDALSKAVQAGNIEIVKILVLAGASQKQEALKLAEEMSRPYVINGLKEAGSKTSHPNDRKGFNVALQMFIKNPDRWLVVRKTINQAADAKDWNAENIRKTLCWLDATNSHAKIAEFLRTEL